MAIKRSVTISFKNTTKDLALFNYINELEDKSNELKQILYKALIKSESDIKSLVVADEAKEELFNKSPNVLNF